jgi:hypothetical protein
VSGPEVRFFADVNQAALGIKHAVRCSGVFDKESPERTRVIAFRRRRLYMAAISRLGQCVNGEWMFQKGFSSIYDSRKQESESWGELLSGDWERIHT